MPVIHSERLHEKLTAAGVKSELVTVKGEGHGWGGPDAAETTEAAIQFLAEHLERASDGRCSRRTRSVKRRAVTASTPSLPLGVRPARAAIAIAAFVCSPTAATGRTRTTSRPSPPVPRDSRD